MRVYLEMAVRRFSCRRRGKVQQERLDCLANNPIIEEAVCLVCGAALAGKERSGCGQAGGAVLPLKEIGSSFRKRFLGPW